MSHNPMLRSNSQGDEPRAMSDLLMPSPGGGGGGSSSDQVVVRGHLSMLVISAKGLRQMMKVRYYVVDRKGGRLRYFRSEDEMELLGEIDIQSATFCYDVQADKNGEFTIW